MDLMSVVLKNSVEISHYRAMSNIGCTTEEQCSPQELAFDIKVFFDPTQACKSDQLTDTVDYMDLKKIIDETCSTKTVHLIEHMGWLIAKKILKDFSLVDNVELKIKKFSTMPQATHVAFNFAISRQDL